MRFSRPLFRSGFFAVIHASVTFSSVTFASPSSLLEGPGREDHVDIAWVGLTRPRTLEYIESLLTDFREGGLRKSPSVLPVPINPASQNPLWVQPTDFAVNDYLPWPLSGRTGQVPEIRPTDAKWFDTQREGSLFPRIFMIGGHHVISEGFHNNAEDRNIFIPTLLETVRKYPSARAYFDKVKLAILFGCNTLTNLEPHRKDGSVMDAEEIRRLYESGPAGKRAVIGSATEVNTLEFYRSRLAREYGPSGAHYEYTRDEKLEKCKGPGKYDNCLITNVDRVFPDSGLFDGSHRYNEALRMRDLFPNAYLVVGFSSASPAEEVRVKIFRAAVEMANHALGLPIGTDVISTILNEDTPEILRKDAIEAFRSAWEKNTFAMNRARPSGSITPAFPDLDERGVVLTRFTNDAQIYAPYRQ